MKLEFPDWRKLGLLSAFFGCDWQGAPRALIFFIFGAREGHAPAEPRWALLVPAGLAPGKAAGSLEPAPSFVRRFGCAAGPREGMWALRGLLFSAPILETMDRKGSTDWAGRAGKLAAGGIMTSAAGKWRRSRCRWKVCIERCYCWTVEQLFSLGWVSGVPSTFPEDCGKCGADGVCGRLSCPCLARGCLEIVYLLGPAFKRRPKLGALCTRWKAHCKRRLLVYPKVWAALPVRVKIV